MYAKYLKHELFKLMHGTTDRMKTFQTTGNRVERVRWCLWRRPKILGDVMHTILYFCIDICFLANIQQTVKRVTRLSAFCVPCAVTMLKVATTPHYNNKENDMTMQMMTEK